MANDKYLFVVSGAAGTGKDSVVGYTLVDMAATVVLCLLADAVLGRRERTAA